VLLKDMHMLEYLNVLYDVPMSTTSKESEREDDSNKNNNDRTNETQAVAVSIINHVGVSVDWRLIVTCLMVLQKRVLYVQCMFYEGDFMENVTKS
jgi:hypothetical protein